MNTREQKIIAYLWRTGNAQSGDIHHTLTKEGETVSLVTIKRALSHMKKGGLLSVSGSGPSTTYTLTEYGKLTNNVDRASYCAQDPDVRYGATKYNFNLFDALVFELFSPSEQEHLKKATDFHRARTHDISPTLHKKELERFVIELSWKSSKIEGNTYTLLDTERLILQGIEAPGHSRDEAQMILNHKDAFSFIHSNKDKFTKLSKTNLTDLHTIIVKNLHVSTNIREKPVGIIGSRYQPLDNKYQIEEAITALSKAIAQADSGYEKSLITLLGISYIQPFEDGNKRTARLAANALLLSHNLAPLSYRSVEEKEYREAMLVFYELNSIMAAKHIFIEQYDFSTQHYLAQ